MAPGPDALAWAVLIGLMPTPVIFPAPGNSPFDGNERTSSLAAGCDVQPRDPSEPDHRVMLCPGHAGWRIERRASREGDIFALIAEAGRRVPLDLDAALGSRVRLRQPGVDWSGLGFYGAPPAGAPTLVLHLERNAGRVWDAIDIVVRLEGSGAPCIVAMIDAGPWMPQRSRDMTLTASSRPCLR